MGGGGGDVGEVTMIFFQLFNRDFSSVAMGMTQTNEVFGYVPCHGEVIHDWLNLFLGGSGGWGWGGLFFFPVVIPASSSPFIRNCHFTIAFLFIF